MPENPYQPPKEVPEVRASEWTDTQLWLLYLVAGPLAAAAGVVLVVALARLVAAWSLVR
jgi:hypothetical protein